MSRFIGRMSAVAAALVLGGFLATAQGQLTHHVYYSLGEGADGAVSNGDLVSVATDTAVWYEIAGANAGLDVDYSATIIDGGPVWSSDTRGPQSDWSLSVGSVFDGVRAPFNAWWNTRVSAQFRIGVEAWIKPSSTIENLGIDIPVVKDLVGLVIGADQKWHYANNGDTNGPAGGFWDYQPGGEALATVRYDEWQHVTAWTTGSTWNLYVDGERITTNNTNNFNYSASDNRALGVDGTGSGDFEGLIDDAGFYFWDGGFDITQTGFFTDLKTGDVNNDTVVDMDDYEIWRMNAGLDLSAMSNSERRAHGDLDANGIADLTDFRVIKENVTAGVVIPEPSSIALLVLGAIGSFAACQRRRVA